MQVQVTTDNQAKPGRCAFFIAVREFDWVAWVQEEAVPDAAADLILEPYPCNRPQTGAEALTPLPGGGC